ncbi:transporter substrate-binding domain-containing protein [Ancylobacter defluvii]|uniref:ABC transporter substrate-binding protein n=1 Tax=Ancylobacter defluvii TaxID=1282440 RepID=A0A9W6K160_9HYPH|nr:transporter substrate-binding domain-containing protein [Ancylobacter defluvii]MBS7589773.1 transporter substrate-binding domain-containing protein [Ancylobacter defluvii]GLK86882.1 ABC transporter substrate-binding protein [Ancylobacter defluvii]
MTGFKLLARRWVLAALALTAAGTVIGTPARAATLEEIKARGYMVVATEDDYKPFEFLEDGKPTGFDNELLVELRKFVPFEIRQEIIPWSGILAGVASGKYDMALTAVIITKPRMETLAFTTPIADATHFYVKRKDDSSIKEIKDLTGKKVGVQTGSAQLDKLPELQVMLDKTGGKLGEVVQYGSYPEAYQDLALGRLDYVVNTIINLRSLVKDKPEVFELGQAVSGRTVPAWAIKKGNTELVELINAFLAEQKKNGNLAKLQEKWFGQSFPDLPVHFEP